MKIFLENVYEYVKCVVPVKNNPTFLKVYPIFYYVFELEQCRIEYIDSLPESQFHGNVPKFDWTLSKKAVDVFYHWCITFLI